MNNKMITQKFISGLIIFTMLTPAIFLSLTPKPAEAQGQVPVLDVAAGKILGTIAGNATSTSGFTGSLNVTSLKSWAEYIGTQLLKIAAKIFLQKMTQATIDWINSGFHGSPLFVENPESFFQDIAKSEIKSLVDMIGYDPFRFPFGPQTALNVIASYKSQLATNAQYTLSKVMNNSPASLTLLANYRNDFNFGGWNGFLINTQYPQNNYLGFNMLIQENLASRLEGTLVAPAKKVQSLLQQGMGFLSPETCADNGGDNAYNKVAANAWQRPSYKAIPFDVDKYPGSSGSTQWEKENNAAKADWAAKNTCKNLVNTTPGSVAANQIFTALNVPINSATLAGALGNDVKDSVSAIFDALINKLISTGLNTLSSTINPAPSNDNWSYNGNTFSDSTTTSGSTTTGGAESLNIPQNVSVDVGKTSSTDIIGSGGKAPYKIDNLWTNIATAKISGNTLTVTGVDSGSTVITITDSSDPVKTVKVKITVNTVGTFSVIPASITTDTNTDNAVTANISGGTYPYVMQTSPNESIAIANVVPGTTSLIVIGTGRGKTFVIVKDSSNKTVRVDIEITAPDTLVITPPTISVNIGEETSLPTIFGGTAGYVITNQSDITVATAEIKTATPTILTVTGHKAGLTTVAVRDSSSPYKSANIFITTIAPKGSCHLSSNGFEVNQQMDQASCDNAGGTWTPNKPLGTCNITTIQKEDACTTATGGIWTPTPPTTPTP